MRHLLDSNIISEMVRAPRSHLAKQVAHAGQKVMTSVIVAAEVRYGVAKRGSAELTARVVEALARIEIAAFEPPADQVYAALRADLERRGCVIGPYDLLIAAHALALDCTLVTDNIREFSRVDGLKVENWLR